MAFNRFEDAPSSVIALVNEVRNQYFSELINVSIRVLFDRKKRTSSGNIVLGRIQKTNDLTRHLTKEDTATAEGYDFILFLDKLAFTNIEKKDQVRLIRHQLRHIIVDPESPKNPYKLVGHDVENFYAELELNKDDIRWDERVREVAMSLYDLDKENESTDEGDY
ncbi:MAG: putative metallopeptidase [Candidatus Magnetobacterium sp. LHC-1]|nr:hypothetical protein [Nitrospirota bacterium]